MWRVALVGAGNISSAHISSLRKLDNIEIVGIADTELSRAEEAAAKFQLPRAVRALAELAPASPDVVHILTPPASHCALAIEALDRGFHVFMEKPMALTTEECDRMIAKAAKVGRRLSVNHSARFDPAVLKALDLVKKGAIGDVLSVDYIRSSEYPPFAGGALPAYYREGGYPFRDLGVHALYVIEAFLGDVRDLQVSYRSSGRNLHLCFDEWKATVDCLRGAGHVYLSWNSRPMENGLVVHGTSGTLLVDSFLETCTLRRSLPGPKVVSLLWNSVVGSLAYAVSVCRNVALFATGRIGPAPDIERSIRAFYEALADGTPAPVSTSEGRRIVGWLDRAASEADRERADMREAEPPLKPAAILVTGASGFLGRATVQALLGTGESLRLFSRRPPTPEVAAHPRVSFICGDLGQPEVVERAMEGIEVVYHVGATTGGSAEDYLSGTIWGTTNMLASALKANVKRFVYISSLSVLDYVAIPNGARVDEQSPLEPNPDQRGLYAKTKLDAEQLVLEAIGKGLKGVILRPGQIFGPGAERVTPYGAIGFGNRWIVMGNGRAELPLVYVEDVVDAMLRSVEFDAAVGRIFQLVDPVIVDQREYLAGLRERCPEIRVSYVPKVILYCAAAGLQILGKLLKRSVPLTFYRLRSLKTHLQFDCSAAQTLLGWSPRIGVKEGLRRTFSPAPATTAAPEAEAVHSAPGAGR